MFPYMLGNLYTLQIGMAKENSFFFHIFFHSLVVWKVLISYRKCYDMTPMKEFAVLSLHCIHLEYLKTVVLDVCLCIY